MYYAITLTGPSRCGKSTVLKLLKQISESGKYPDFHPVPIPKYTTRDFREEDIDAVVNGRSSELDVMPVIGNYNIIEGIDSAKQHELRMNAFKELNCDLAYEQYGDRYGLHLQRLYDCLKNCETPIVILNDVRTVEDIRTALGKQCISLFIFREVPNLDTFLKEAPKRKESPEKATIRFEKAESIYRIYIENIHIFDKLILNTQNGIDELQKILQQLIEKLCSPAPLFVERG